MESQGEQDKVESRRANRDAASRYRQRKRDREHSIERAVAQVFNDNAVLREANRRLRAALPPSLLPPDSILLQLEQRGLVSQWLFASSVANNRSQPSSACAGGSGGGGFGGAFDSSGGGPAAMGGLAVPYMPGYLPPPPQQQQQQQLQLPFFSAVPVAVPVGSGGVGGGGFGSGGGGFGGTYSSRCGTAAGGAMVAAYIPPLPPPQPPMPPSRVRALHVLGNGGKFVVGHGGNERQPRSTPRETIGARSLPHLVDRRTDSFCTRTDVYNGHV
jgi:hypothetical protein